MKKLLIYILLFYFFTSCKSENYYGYVYDFNTQMPLSNVLVKDFLNNHQTLTNNIGFFELPKGAFSGKLIFFKKNYSIDTINSIEINNGEQMKEKFKGEKIFLFNEINNFRDSIKRLNTFE